MAEHDPLTPPDDAEAAYREALLADDAGRDPRRARLMAALPRPQAAATPVSRDELAWSWQPYALGALATGLLVAAVLALRGGPQGLKPESGVEARRAAVQAAVPAQAGADATVVAQASPAAEPAAARPAPPHEAAKATRQRPPAAPSRPMVVADAGLARQDRAREAAVASAVEAPPAVMAQAPVMAPPPAAPVMPAAKMAADRAVAAAVSPAPAPAEALARAEAASNATVTVSGSAVRGAVASEVSQPVAPPALAAASADLLAAVRGGEVAAVRDALQAGASPHQRDAQGRTVLMLAARNGSREVAELLLSAGARKTERDSRGWTAADHALDQGHGDLAERLR